MGSRQLGALARLGPLLLLACGDRSLYLGRPGDDHAQAMILALPGPSSLDVRAIDLTQGSLWLDEIVSDEAHFEITALVYPSTLHELGLVEGPIVAVPERECGGQRLPLPERVQSAWVDREQLDAAEWRIVEVVPAALAAFRRAGPCPCRDVEIIADFELPDVTARVSSRIDGRRALVPVGKMGAFSYYEVGPDGVAPVPLVDAPLRPFATAYFDDDNIWIGDLDGLYNGGRRRPFTLVSGTATVGGVVALAGPRKEDFFLVSDKATLFRVRDGVPDPIVSAPTRDSRQEGIIAHLSFDRYVAAISTTYQLVRLAGGGLDDMLTVPPDTHGATAIALGGDDALYVGTSLGIVLRLEGLELLAIDGDELTTVTVLAPFEDGVLFGTERGGLRQISGRYGYCPFQPSLEDIRFVSVVSLDDGHLFIGSSTRGNARAVLLR